MHFLSTVTGSFAMPADENPTVAMMEAAYAHHGIDARYLNCEVAPESLAAAVNGARAMGWVGFNCSIPHKIAVIPLLDRLAESAEIIGAVNCVVREGRELIGHNFDGQGFLTSLRPVLDPTGARVAILGAGGAARAIAVELALAGAAEVQVVSLRPEPGRALARLITERTPAVGRSVAWEGAWDVPAGVDLLVNATPVGLFPDVTALPAVNLDTLEPGTVLADVIPNPPTSALISAAAARGITTLDGLGMLVNQGALAVELWTGVDPDRAVMRDRLAEIFSGDQS
ncbi:MAG: shikimate dehydrogenase [Propionicimonas sp.]